MRHRLRNRIIIRCLSSGETGCALMPDDTDVNPGVAQPDVGVPRCVPDVRPPDVAHAAYSAYAADATYRHISHISQNKPPTGH